MKNISNFPETSDSLQVHDLGLAFATDQMVKLGESFTLRQEENLHELQAIGYSSWLV